MFSGDAFDQPATAVRANPPAWRSRWTLEPLSGEKVRLTEHRRLSEIDLMPWRKDKRRIPKADAVFVAAMEVVLGLCGETADPKRPAV